MRDVSLSRGERMRKLKDARRELCGSGSRKRFSVYNPVALDMIDETSKHTIGIDSPLMGIYREKVSTEERLEG
jgi:hypothetical protein